MRVFVHLVRTNPQLFIHNFRNLSSLLNMDSFIFHMCLGIQNKNSYILESTNMLHGLQETSANCSDNGLNNLPANNGSLPSP